MAKNQKSPWQFWGFRRGDWLCSGRSPTPSPCFGTTQVRTRQESNGSFKWNLKSSMTCNCSQREHIFMTVVLWQFFWLPSYFTLSSVLSLIITSSMIWYEVFNLYELWSLNETAQSALTNPQRAVGFFY
jgi:hypothetical protein